MDNNELEMHKQRIDQQIKAGIDRLLQTGDVLESDFALNEDGDKIITITDEQGEVIVFNYTKVRLLSYGNRVNPPAEG